MRVWADTMKISAISLFSGLMPAAPTRMRALRLARHMAAISAATQPPMEEPIST